MASLLSPPSSIAVSRNASQVLFAGSLTHPLPLLLNPEQLSQLLQSYFARLIAWSHSPLARTHNYCPAKASKPHKGSSPPFSSGNFLRMSYAHTETLTQTHTHLHYALSPLHGFFGGGEALKTPELWYGDQKNLLNFAIGRGEPPILRI